MKLERSAPYTEPTAILPPEKPEITQAVLDFDPREIERLSVQVTNIVLHEIENISSQEKREEMYLQMIKGATNVRFAKWFRAKLTFQTSHLSTHIRTQLLLRAVMNEKVIQAVYGETNMVGILEPAVVWANNLKYENLPIWNVDTPEGTSLIIDRQIINPLSYIATQRFFNIEIENVRGYNPENKGALPNENYWNLILLGKLYGYFDDDNPKNEYYRALITPFITDNLPLAIQELKSTNLDSKRLQLLKKTWPAVFTSYWIALSRTQNAGLASPLSAQNQQMGGQQLPPYMSVDQVPERLQRARGVIKGGIGQARAEALDQASFQGQNLRLQQHIVELAQAYFKTDTVNFQQLRKIFSHTISYEIFGVVTNSLVELKSDQVTSDTLRVVAANLESIFTKKNIALELIFGDEWQDTAPIEKVCVLTFTAFISNGQISGNTRRVVEVIQNRLLPLLELHNDIGIEKPDVLAGEKINFTFTEYNRAKIKALARLQDASFEEDYIISANQSDALELFDENEAWLDQFHQVSRLTAKRKNILTHKRLTEFTNKHGGLLAKFLLENAKFYIPGTLAGAVGGAIGMQLSGREVSGLVKDIGSIYSIISVPMLSIILYTFFSRLNFAQAYQKTDIPLPMTEEKLKGLKKRRSQEYKGTIKVIIGTYLLVLLISSLLFGGASHKNQNSGEQESEQTAQQEVGQDTFEQNSTDEENNTDYSYTEALNEQIGELIDQMLGNDEEGEVSDAEESNSTSPPNFYVFGEVKELFWPFDLPEGLLSILEHGQQEQDMYRSNDIEYVESLTALQERIRMYESEGYLVRMNLDGTDLSFETPQDYKVEKVIVLDSNFNYQATTNSIGLVQVNKTSDPENSSFSEDKPNIAVVYKLNPDTRIILSVLDQLSLMEESSHILTPEEWQNAPAFPKVMAEVLSSNKGLPREELIFTVVDLLKQQGFSIGNPEGVVPSEMSISSDMRLALLFAGDGEGWGKGHYANPVWSKEDAFFVVTQILSQLEISSYKINGYLDNDESNFGGFGNSVYSKLLFLSDEGDWQYYDVVQHMMEEGDGERISYEGKDILEKMIEAEEKRKMLLTYLFAGITSSAVGIGIQALHGRTQKRRREKFGGSLKEKRTETKEKLGKLSTHARIAIWGMFMSVLGIVDVNINEPEKTKHVSGWYSFHYGELSVSEESSEKLARDFITIISNPEQNPLLLAKHEAKIDAVIKMYELSGRETIKTELFFTAVIKHWYRVIMHSNESDFEKHQTKMKNSFALVIPAIEKMMTESHLEVTNSELASAFDFLKKLESIYTIHP